VPASAELFFLKASAPRMGHPPLPSNYFLDFAFAILAPFFSTNEKMQNLYKPLIFPVKAWQSLGKE
jgi:hypothetical protein